MPRLQLLDVDDAFALAHGVVKRSGLELSWHDREDLVAFLVAAAWELSLGFDPACRKGGRTDFAGYATIALRRRVIDWQRQRNGAHGLALRRPGLRTATATRARLT